MNQMIAFHFIDQLITKVIADSFQCLVSAAAPKPVTALKSSNGVNVLCYFSAAVGAAV